MGGSKSPAPAEKKARESAQDEDSDEESSMITRDTAKEEDLVCSKSTNSVINRFTETPKLDDHNEADDIADKIEETLLSYADADAEPLDTDSLPRPMFGGEPDHHEEAAPKFGAFQGDSEDDGMPMASQEAELFNMNDYSQP
jgi:hypothetical protein